MKMILDVGPKKSRNRDQIPSELRENAPGGANRGGNGGPASLANVAYELNLQSRESASRAHRQHARETQ